MLKFLSHVFNIPGPMIPEKVDISSNSQEFSGLKQGAEWEVRHPTWASALRSGGLTSSAIMLASQGCQI